MRLKCIMLLFLAGFSLESAAQFTRYIIRFRHKGATPHTLSSPGAYLSPRALDRRTRYAIPVDSSDLPVPPSYISQVQAVPNVTVLNQSRWLNAITIQTNDPNALTAINALSFVQVTAPIAARSIEGRTGDAEKFRAAITPVAPAPSLSQRITADFFNYGTGSYNEIHLHNGEFLHNIGLRGQGMQIAMLDNGYSNYTNLRSFDSVVANNQVLGSWDFVNRETNVANDGSHGMSCFSTIAGNIPGQFIGKAPKASFWLFKTEDDASEYPIEEFNWVCGAERADSAGADVISSSLGYNTFDNASLNHTYGQLNGNTTIAAIGADLAAKKGVLVFNSAGNEGANSWKFIITPADADSIVAVGAVNASGSVWPSSSFGPSGDGQVKPDMSSIGWLALFQTTSNTIASGNGTSFACPNMAGLGTCLWQGFPEYSNMKIIGALRQAGHKFTSPDDRVGYGIPDMKKAFGFLVADYATAGQTVSNCRVTINWNSRDVGAMKYEIERKGPAETNFTKVGELPAQAGLLLANRSYSFAHDVPGGQNGTYQFRIRQLLDTSAAGLYGVYIDTVTATVNNCVVTGTGNPVSSGLLLRIQPNPYSGGELLLLAESTYPIAELRLHLFNAAGQEIMDIQESKNAGRKWITLPGNRLPSGTYFLRVLNGHRHLNTIAFSVL